MKGKLRRRISSVLALLMTVALVFQTGFPVFAEEGAQADALTDTAVTESSNPDVGEPESVSGESPDGDAEDTLPEAAQAVQTLMDALPDADGITAENADDAAEQLDAIDEAKCELTDEELALVDFSKYDAAAEALTGISDEPAPIADSEVTASSGWPAAVAYTDGVTQYFTYNNYLYKAVWSNLSGCNKIQLFYTANLGFRFKYNNEGALTFEGGKTTGSLPKTAGETLELYSTITAYVSDSSKPVLTITCLAVNGTPTWAWESDYSAATATFTATDGSTTISATVNASVTSEVDKTETKTCTEYYPLKYSGSVTFNGETYTDGQTGTSTTTGPHTLTHHDMVEATDTTDGTVEYWSCSVCGKKFSDEEGTQELSSIIIDASVSKPVTDNSGVYQIDTAKELLWFAKLVNGTATDGTVQNQSASAILTANIDLYTLGNWTPIGTSENDSYYGTFDGAGHTISGLYINTTAQYKGLFGCINGTVKNLIVEGNVTVSGSYAKYIGGIVGYNNYGTIDNCVSNVTVKGYQKVGGIAGLNLGTISNCIGFGKVSVTKGGDWYGAILGSQEVTGNAKTTNCYWLNTAASKAVGYQGKGTVSNITSKTAEQFASGEVCYLLNGSVSGGTTWYQTIGTDSYPVPDSTHGMVYTDTRCDGTITGYNNTAATTAEHQESSSYGYDTSQHWALCSVCGGAAAENRDHDTGGDDGACSVCGYLAASGDGSGSSPYVITTAEQLYAIANAVNSGTSYSEMYFILGNNIDFSSYDVMIGGMQSNSFSGIFDGKGYSVTVNYSTSEAYTALFRSVDGATIQNLTVKGSISTSAKQAAGIAAYVGSNGATITNCVSEAAITSTVSGDGTHGGIVGSTHDSAVLNITNCAFIGSMSGSSTTCCGGIVGYANSGSNTTITNCYTNATYSIGTSSCCEISRNTSANIVNCYYVNSIGGTAQGTQASAADATYGKLAYLLNGSVSGGTNWYQNLDNGEAVDANPVLNSSHGTVYMGYKNSTVTCTERDNPYSNSSNLLNTCETVTHEKCSYQYDETQHWQVCDSCGETVGEKAAHDTSGADGACSVCGYSIPTGSGTEEDPYLIDNAIELKWFADLVNGNLTNTTQNTAAFAKLTADIDLSGDSYTPIGNSSNLYTGTFDGDGHSVTLVIDSTSDAQALFGYVGGGVVIKNVVVKGSVSGAGYCAGLVGISNSSGTITIMNCGNEAAVTGTGANIAGILGSVWNGTAVLTNCYNTGTISGDKESAGISGWLGSNAVVTNCYNAGKVTGYDSGKTFARFNGSKVASFNNCYQLDTVGTQDNITSRTEDEFASGEVTWLLNSSSSENVTWCQTIGTDSCPNFTGGTVYPTYSCAGSTTITAYNNTKAAIAEHTDTDNDGKCDVCGEKMDGKTASVVAYSLSLNGNIGVNFYVEVPGNKETDKVQVQFTVNGTTSTVELSSDKTGTYNGTTCYIFSCELAAKQMTDEITVQVLYDGATVGEAKTYSVRGYAAYILEHQDTYSSVADLMKAMLNYGAYAQTLFSYNTDNLANSGYEDSTISNVTSTDVESFQYSKDENSKNVEFASASLILESETTLRLYFKGTSDDVDVASLTCTVDGVTKVPQAGSGDHSGEYYLEVKNISSPMLGKNHTFVVDGTTISYSPMSYVYAALSVEGGISTLEGTVKALYRYYEAAKSYFG